MTKSCETCCFNDRNCLGVKLLGVCQLWRPITVHPSVVDAAKYTEKIDYHGSMTVTRQDNGTYLLKMD